MNIEIILPEKINIENVDIYIILGNSLIIKKGCFKIRVTQCATPTYGLNLNR